MGQRADVLIADGSSTDGALAGDFPSEHGVRVLLVMQGPGGQSAQLRLAFAYAMRQGYEGIVQVDGNNKDGVEAIPRFLDELNAGSDYVQGNRFTSGGEQVNTPARAFISHSSDTRPARQSRRGQVATRHDERVSSLQSPLSTA